MARKWWPAIDVVAEPDGDDVLMAALDDFAPTALDSRDECLRVFFATVAHRDAACLMLGARHISATPTDVSDEDWAARSQQNLVPITIGRITILPTAPADHFTTASEPLPTDPASTPADFPADDDRPIAIVIEPSMGFGTGHHATTRLCLEALQAIDVSDKFVLDIGTGSGILALAASRLRAARAHGIDFDGDAIQSAENNLALNPLASNVTFATTDVDGAALFPADVVLANLTGAALARSADRLIAATAPGGTLIISGILASEEDDVQRAFSSATLRHRAQEDEWVCLTVTVENRR